MSGLKGARGFTLVEVLVALSVVAISLAAIGSLIAVTTRGARAVGLHLTLVETARSIVTGLARSDQLAPGDLVGGTASHSPAGARAAFYSELVPTPPPTRWWPRTSV